MDMEQALYDLLEEVLGYLLTELPSLPHIRKQISSCTQFHHNQEVLLSFKRLEKLDHVLVPQRFEQ